MQRDPVEDPQGAQTGDARTLLDARGPVHLDVLAEQGIGQICAVLAGDAENQCLPVVRLHGRCAPSPTHAGWVPISVGSRPRSTLGQLSQSYPCVPAALTGGPPDQLPQGRCGRGRYASDWGVTGAGSSWCAMGHREIAPLPSLERGQRRTDCVSGQGVREGQDHIGESEHLTSFRADFPRFLSRNSSAMNRSHLLKTTSAATQLSVRFCTDRVVTPTWREHQDLWGGRDRPGRRTVVWPREAPGTPEILMLSDSGQLTLEFDLYECDSQPRCVVCDLWVRRR
jgi:hypothetical protein